MGTSQARAAKAAKARRFVTTREAAEMLGVPTHAIARRVRAGLLSQWVDGTDMRVRLIDADELERLMQPQPVRREEAPVPAA